MAFEHAGTGEGRDAMAAARERWRWAGSRRGRGLAGLFLLAAVALVVGLGLTLRGGATGPGGLARRGVPPLEIEAPAEAPAGTSAAPDDGSGVAAVRDEPAAVVEGPERTAEDAAPAVGGDASSAVIGGGEKPRPEGRDTPRQIYERAKARYAGAARELAAHQLRIDRTRLNEEIYHQLKTDPRSPRVRALKLEACRLAVLAGDEEDECERRFGAAP